MRPGKEACGSGSSGLPRLPSRTALWEEALLNTGSLISWGGLGFQFPLSSAFLTGGNYLRDALMLNNDALMRAAFLPTGASCFLRGSWPPSAHSGRLPGPAGARTDHTEAGPASCRSTLALPPWSEEGLLPSSWPCVPSSTSLAPSLHCPPSHWWFLPAEEIQETTTHISSAHSFSRAWLTHSSAWFGVPLSPPMRNPSHPIHFWERRLAREGGLVLSLIIDLSSLNKGGGAYWRQITEEQMWGCWLWLYVRVRARTHTDTQTLTHLSIGSLQQTTSARWVGFRWL